jgi:hypothetical protein
VSVFSAITKHPSQLGLYWQAVGTSLHKWLTAIFLTSRTEQGTNAVALSKIIGVTYKTAWLILHKIHHAMSAADQGKLLSGIVQVNSAVYGKRIADKQYRIYYWTF